MFASEELKNDREIVMVAIKSYSQSLEFASKRLRNDKKIILYALNNNLIISAIYNFFGNDIKKYINGLVYKEDMVCVLQFEIEKEYLDENIVNSKTKLNKI